MHKATERQPRKLSLRWRINAALAAVGVLLIAGIMVQGRMSQDLIESRYWQILLGQALENLRDARRDGGDGRLPHGRVVYGWREPALRPEEVLPSAFAGLPPGFSGEQVSWRGREYEVLVEQVGDERITLAVDVTLLEQAQNRSVFYGLQFALLAVLLIGLVLWWLARHLSQPVRDLAERMAALDPGVPGQRLPTHYRELEIAGIADAVNAHLDRVDHFVERERALLDQASHEFRTPIAVISGATDVLRALPQLPPAAQRPLRRIEETIDGLREIMIALLYLAREHRPDGIEHEWCELHRLLPLLVADHEHLLQEKPVAFLLESPPALTLLVPEAMLRIAVGNLLRNAAENTLAGAIHVAVDARGMLQVTDTGVGFDPARVARDFTRSLREGPKGGARGLGLFLVQRICERFDWTLHFEPTADGGTRASLDLGASLKATT